MEIVHDQKQKSLQISLDPSRPLNPKREIIYTLQNVPDGNLDENVPPLFSEEITELVRLLTLYTPKSDALIIQKVDNYDERLKEETRKILEIPGSIRESPSCDCDDDFCPHKSRIHPLVPLLIASTKNNLHEVNMSYWQPLEYPIIKYTERSYVYPSFLFLKRKGLDINMLRTSLSYSTKTNTVFYLPRNAEFIEGIIITSEITKDDTLTLTFNSNPVYLSLESRYVFLGMIPIRMAAYTQISFEFCSKEEKEIQFDIICHFDFKYMLDRELERMNATFPILDNKGRKRMLNINSELGIIHSRYTDDEWFRLMNSWPPL